MLFSHTHHLTIFNYGMVGRQRELELKYITESVECNCSLIWYLSDKLLMSSKHEFFIQFDNVVSHHLEQVLHTAALKKQMHSIIRVIHC